MYIALNNGLLSVRYASITRADCSAANPLSFYKRPQKNLTQDKIFQPKKEENQKFVFPIPKMKNLID